MTDARAMVLGPVVRLLERVLPVGVLLGIFSTIAAGRALSSRLFKGSLSLRERPPWLAPEDEFKPRYLDRFPRFLDRPLMFFPDRLGQPKWRRRCRFIGLEQLQSADGCGGILAFVHFGPFQLLRSWLRAAGVPVSVLVSYAAGDRAPALRRHHDRSLFQEVPPTYHLEDLPAALNHLKVGRPLAMSLDSKSGRLMEVRVGDDWTFTSATGAVRIARRHQVPLFACSIHREGPWRYVVEISPPVPESVWADGDEAVGAWLMDRIFPLLRRHPDQCLLRLIDQIQPRRKAALAVSVP